MCIRDRAGVVLTAVGLYEPLVEFAEAGATVPLTGFGYSLAKGVERAVGQYGLLGALSGGTVATAAGIAAAIFFGYLNALIFNPKKMCIRDRVKGMPASCAKALQYSTPRASMAVTAGTLEDCSTA